MNTRTRRTRWPIAIVLTLLVVGAPVHVAAQEVDTEIPISSVDTDGYPDVRIDFGVPSELGGVELDPADIVLTENGTSRPFELRRTATRNLQVVLAIDTSGSMVGTPITQAKAAAASFVNALPPGTEIAIVEFGDTAEVRETFNDSAAEVESIVAAIEVDPVAETAIYDALLVAVRQFVPTHDGPQYVIVVTDGGDTASEATLGRAQAAVEAAEVPILALSLVTSESDPEALRTLTSGASSALVEATDPAALTALATEVATTIGSEYRIRYDSLAEGPTTIELALDRDGTRALGRVAVDMPKPAVIAPLEIPTPTGTPEPVPARSQFDSVTLDVANRSWLLPLGVTALGLSMAVFTGFLLWPTRRRRNPVKELGAVGVRAARGSENLLSNASRSVIGAAERFLSTSGRAGAITRRLERAGIRMRPAEFIVLLGCATVVAGLLGLMTSGLALGLVLAIVVPVVIWLVLSAMGRRRADAFAEQLPATLQMMGGGLKAGFSLSQVVEFVSRDAQAPTCDEFARLSAEENLGRDVTASFRDLAARMESQDFGWVAEAVDINRAVGGDLADVFENVAETIRTRQSIAREIKTLSAEGRLSAMILVAVPFIIALGQFLINRELSNELTSTTAGRVLIVIGLVMISIGALWLKRITRLKF